MKVWTNIRLREQNYNINQMSKSLSNYLYKNGPINEIIKKYNIANEDIKKLNQYTTNKIAGLLMLYIAKNKPRINDIINKYSTIDNSVVIPELEGYIEK